MRVHAPSNGGYTAPTSSARRSATGSFAVAEREAPRAAASVVAPRALTSLDVLMALQGFDDPGERRRRALKRGRTTLDALDALKIGLLAGTLDAGALVRLKAVVAELGEASGDVRLDTILSEIELRAAVELAKFAAIGDVGRL